jgi:phage-related baseplate assembly protein
VLVTVLSAKGDGTPDTTLLEAVDAALSAEDVRPLTDQVIVQGADVVPFGVQAGLTLYDGPDSEAVRQAAYAAVVDYVTRNHRIGRDIALSGLYAALHQPGVQHVTLNAPMADIVISAQQAPYCTGVTVTVEGTDE